MMSGIAEQRIEVEGLSTALQQVERRLGWALAVLLLGIVGMLGAHLGQPVVTYLSGTTMNVSAGVEGAGCGSHLEWAVESYEIDAGSRVTFANDTTYWQITVVVERAGSDGTFERVASSPALRGGEDWTHTIWRNGEYRIVSADETQRLAGLETIISVK